MGLFQQSVLEKYLKQLDDNIVKEAYKKFQDYFHNPDRQANIRAAKEEQFQEGFLRELFVKIFGYTINPEPDYNLTSEFKNETGAKKADGAILIDGNAIGVIELKGTDTKDLDKINDQAFSYKNNQGSCVYVVTSNFEKLRFFIQNAVDHEEFNLFELTEEEFKLLWVCLQNDNLLSGIPEKIKEESLLEEEEVTKRLYADYSAFKRELWQDLVQRNPDYDELLLFKKSQKLLDRFLFILFSEDKGLLPPNSISEIVKQWQDLKDLDEYRPLYDRYKKYFGYMNEGYKGKKYEIHAYNGGLFCDDEVLDSVVIDDEVLRKHTMKLTEYDFNSDVDVNILGHIFEHSLSEIENVRAKLEGIDVDKSKSKRKKDGVFYTPRYITKYIVDNTVGRLCVEKKEDLGITDERFREAGKRTRKGIKDLEDYREWLLGLTICDPACGSGAFLNQALEFLIKEHSWLDELLAEYHGSNIVFPDVEKHILENNLYGVDINEESVEIAKLSLWLRTAQQGRKLTTLSDNIKCGNSLIDDPEVAGDKAFIWEQEFPEIFSKGGFDVVIGNPPYVRVEFVSKSDVKYYKENYSSASSKFDLSSLFFEKSLRLLHKKGICSIITSYQFIYTSSGIGLRKFITENTLTSVVMFSSDYQVFQGATTYVGIFIVIKAQSVGVTVLSANNAFNEVNITNKFTLTNENFSSSKVIVANTTLLDRIESNTSVIKGNVIGMAKTGVVTSADEVFYLTPNEANDFNLEDSLIYPIIGPTELDSWTLQTPETLCLYPYVEEHGKTKLISLKDLELNFNGIHSYLVSKKDILIGRSQGRKDYSESDKWYQLNRPREKWIYDSQKIIYPGTTNRPKFALDSKGQLFRNARVYAYLLKPEYKAMYKVILPILNSMLCKYLISLKCPPKANNYYEMSTGFMEDFPFILPEGEDILCYRNIANRMITLNEAFFNISSKFLGLLQSETLIKKVTKKVENWYSLNWGDFEKELKKLKIVLSGEKKEDWYERFNRLKIEAQELKHQIEQSAKEIDQMVYKLYGLTEEEIKIVEES